MKLIKKFILICMVLVLSFYVNFKINVVSASNEIDLKSKSAYLIDYDSGSVIFAKNENARMPIASMTKIMLLLLAYENIEKGNLSLTEEVTISKTASGMGGSQVFLEENGVYTVENLLKSITVASANDASVAISERLFGSEKECVKKMNEKANSLKLRNTLFANCTGLPAPMQYSSAKDIAIIFANLLKYKNYFKYSTIWTDTIKHSKNQTEITNTNKLVKFYNGCDGGKTGFTNEAGFCLTATAKRGNLRVIGSVINCPSSKERFSDVSTMFNYAFDNYTNKCVVDNDFPLESKVKVQNSKQKEIQVIPEVDGFIFSPKNNNDKIEVEYNYYNLKAPVKKGAVVGEVLIYKNGVLTKKVNVLANENADKMSYIDHVKSLFEKWA